MKVIDQIIEACERCIGCKSADSCYGCPYEPEDKCYDRLCDDIIFQLKRLKKLEKPTEKEQPELPGMECFRLEKNLSGKITNMIPISYPEYLKAMEDHGETEE